jgi:3-deoxy-D-manno-octulosonic-acid transferase
VPDAAPPPIVRDPNPGVLRALLHLFYDATWLAAIVLASPWWLARALVDRRFARMAAQRVTLGLPRLRGGARPRVLVHGVSVGEVKGAAPLVRALEQRFPGVDVVVSASTDTGVEIARRTFPEHVVVRFPLDPSWWVKRFLRRLDPAAVVLIELEIWPNFLRHCNRRGLPIAVANGRITDRSFLRYDVFKSALPQFNRISFYGVQLEEYAERFRRLGGAPERVVVTGNLKADGLGERAGREQGRAADALRALLDLEPGRPTFVAGSTHGDEERSVLAAWSAGLPAARLVLVPRHPPRADEVAAAVRERGFAVQRLTELRAGARADRAAVVLVDTIGELETLYALADLVFVGGSLVERGGQNVLEPAALGRAVLHGPHMDNFRQEAALLAAAGASRAVADADELARALAELAADPARRGAMGEAGRAAVASQAGATARTLALLEQRCLRGLGGAFAVGRSADPE